MFRLNRLRVRRLQVMMLASCSAGRRFTILITGLMAVLHAGSPGQILPFHYYTVRDGLISNSVNTFFQDSRGYLWIGTNDGISVYDSHSFTNYTTNDGLIHNFVTGFVEDRFSPGTMWIATRGGVSKFSDGKFTGFNLDTPAWAKIVHALIQDRRGVIWCATDSSVIRIDHDTILPPFLPPLSLINVQQIVEDQDGFLYFTSAAGLYCYDPGTNAAIELQESPGAHMNTSLMALDANGDLWAGDWNGDLLRIRGAKIIASRTSPTAGIDLITNDREGNLWFGSYDGLFRVSKKNFAASRVDHFTTANGLEENTLLSAYVDG